ncbi:glycine cleavage system protein GcvH [uncultured Jatrophihabitans sp.]|uniref:glycine cleavage system protein GcvH n=1 Tax=uncultured Jatrophihabitans sp. TaxID=1610747 RepID=UPI0035CB08E8
MSDVPDDLRYTAEHEWVRATQGSTTVRIGITDYAQEALGDVVYVSLPALGDGVEKGAAVGEVESTKSVSDIFAPLAGTVSARNEALDGTPELINSDPYGEGWLLELEVSDAAEIDGLLDAASYGALAG